MFLITEHIMVPMVMTESERNRMKSHRNISLKEWLTLPYSYTTGIFFATADSHIILFAVDFFNLCLQELMTTMIQMWVVNSSDKKKLVSSAVVQCGNWMNWTRYLHPTHCMLIMTLMKPRSPNEGINWDAFAINNVFQYWRYAASFHLVAGLIATPVVLN